MIDNGTMEMYHKRYGPSKEPLHIDVYRCDVETGESWIDDDSNWLHMHWYIAHGDDIAREPLEADCIEAVRFDVEWQDDDIVEKIVERSSGRIIYENETALTGGIHVTPKMIMDAVNEPREEGFVITDEMTDEDILKVMLKEDGEEQ